MKLHVQRGIFLCLFISRIVSTRVRLFQYRLTRWRLFTYIGLLFIIWCIDNLFHCSVNANYNSIMYLELQTLKTICDNELHNKHQMKPVSRQGRPDIISVFITYQIISFVKTGLHNLSLTLITLCGVNLILDRRSFPCAAQKPSASQFWDFMTLSDYQLWLHFR